MTHPESVPDTTEGQLDAVLADAAAAARPLGAMRPRDRAALLVAVADALDAAGDALVPLAQDESGLPVFDFLTMIDYFYAGTHRKAYQGYY